MKVLLADKAGMCFGVKRALTLALEQAKTGEKTWILNELVHNRQVTEKLAEAGIPSGGLEEIPEGVTVILPSHGVSKEDCRLLEERGCRLVDATCPLVKAAREQALAVCGKGYHLLIFGNAEHDEIRGYLGWLPEDVTVTADPEADPAALKLRKPLALMAQTTENILKFEALEKRLEEAGYEPLVLDTICSATRERREAAEALAAKVDAVLVIGGKNSSNTNKLADYCRRIQPKTYLVETKEDVALNTLKGIKLLGITAGASTPEWIIEEVVKMTEEFKEQALEQEAQNTQTEQETEANFSEMEAEMGCREFHPGDVVKGTVVKVSSDEVLVDIGYKSEGIIPAFELAFTKVDPQTVAKVGDEITAEVVKEDREGNIILSRKAALFDEKIQALEEAFEKGESVTATVIDVVKGGLLVDVGMRGFVPASHVERGFVKDLNEYLKKTLDFKILELNRNGKKVILSRKALLEEEYKKAKEAFWNTIEEGETRKGIVKRLTDFGAFIDIGGCDGLLHVSEMGWGKVAKPGDVVSIGDEIEVYVLKADREKEKVSLSLKKLIPNPWDLAPEKYQVGQIYTGKVMRSAPFGAFIQLEPGLEGLAHISQLAKFRVNKVEEVLAEGMEVPVKILDIDMEKKRISLSVKEAVDLPKREIPREEAEEAAPAVAAVPDAAAEVPKAEEDEAKETAAVEIPAEENPAAENVTAGEAAGEAVPSTEE